MGRLDITKHLSMGRIDITVEKHLSMGRLDIRKAPENG
jgi:hypothetical protein